MLGRFGTDSWGGKRGPGEKVIVIVWVGAKVTGGLGGGGSHGGGDVVAFWVWKEDGLVSWTWVLSGLRDWKSDGSREGDEEPGFVHVEFIVRPIPEGVSHRQLGTRRDLRDGMGKVLEASALDVRAEGALLSTLAHPEEPSSRQALQ